MSKQWVRRLVLWRHGQTAYNLQGRMQGHLDTELNEFGRAQAREAAKKLIGHNPQHIVSSDLHRAYETACALAELTNLTVHVDPRLRETDLGQWTGLTHDEVDQQWPGCREQWQSDALWAPPRGETRIQVAHRAYNLVEQLLRTHHDWGNPEGMDQPIVLTSHGGCVAALTAQLMDLPLTAWPSLGGLANASWVVLTGRSQSGIDPIRWRLDVWNAADQWVQSEVQ